jgi:hypothetical protein
MQLIDTLRYSKELPSSGINVPLPRLDDNQKAFGIILLMAAYSLAYHLIADRFTAERKQDKLLLVLIHALCCVITLSIFILSAMTLNYLQ